jgi:hypothetical protein
VPDIATEALVSGLDSPALRQLAGLIRPVYSDVESLLERAAVETGTFPVGEEVVGRRLSDNWLQNAIPVAKHIALRMRGGELDIAEGWLSLPYRDGDLGPIAVFFQREVPDSSVVFDKAFRERILAASEVFLRAVLT